jgi:hypothetical protein
VTNFGISRVAYFLYSLPNNFAQPLLVASTYWQVRQSLFLVKAPHDGGYCPFTEHNQLANQKQTKRTRKVGVTGKYGTVRKLYHLGGIGSLSRIC